ncbi:MAG: PA0069 family radical SAM protein, partial [Kiloniellales bacterium]|nr:PA0069 family radical SAM protein [Kiloniellales bacterium]
DTGPEERRPETRETRVLRDSTRRKIARNHSPDSPFDRSLNPYRGCEHGCVYCFARPTHAWLGLSPGLDFETRLFAKPDAAELLRAELANPRYRPATIALGTVTDPYQPVERGLEITRSLLAVLKETRHPVAIVTKSPLVTRDLDLLAPMAELGVVRVLLSVTTLDPDLARRMEPRAAAPKRRLEAIAALAAAGVPVGVLAAPMIPAVNDAELEGILDAAAAAGARTAGYVLLRLPLEIKELFEEWLEAHYPDRKAKVLKLVRETRGGRLYESGWGVRMRGRGVYAELLEKRFRSACRKSGLDRGEWALDETRFRRPATPGDPAQMSLF